MPENNNSGFTPIPRKSPEPVERRKRKKDWVIRSVSLCSIVAWILTLFSVVTIERSMPRGENIFTRFMGAPVKSTWTADTLRMGLYALLANLIICCVGFVLNMLRHRRKTDKYSLWIIIPGIISVVGLILYLVVFGKYL